LFHASYLTVYESRYRSINMKIILEIQNVLHKLLAQILLESYNPLYDKLNILLYIMKYMTHE